VAKVPARKLRWIVILDTGPLFSIKLRWIVILDRYSADQRLDRAAFVAFAPPVEIPPGHYFCYRAR
jgi:hypothetical protein